MANDTSSYREHGSCPLSLAFHVGLTFVLFVICVSGLLGNTATLLTIGLTRSLHTVPNAYIANLAVIGLLVCIVLVPFTAVGYMTYVPQNVCKVMAYPNFSYMAVLLYSIALVAVNRYVLVVRSRSLYVRLYTRRNVTLSIAATWALGLLLGSPPYLGFGGFAYNHKFGASFVKENDSESWMFLQVVIVGCCFCPTLVITLYCYLLITLTTIRSQKRVQSVESSGNSNVPIVPVSEQFAQPSCPNVHSLSSPVPVSDNDTSSAVFPNPAVADGVRLAVQRQLMQHNVNSDHKHGGVVHGRVQVVNRASVAVLKRIIAVWIVFFFCWLPLTMFVMFDRADGVSALAMHTTFVISQSNSALNPVVYFGVGREFRQASKALIKRLRRRMWLGRTMTY